MEPVKPLNVAIVGGGPGCKAIMDMIFAEKLSQLHMKLIGVACTHPESVGYRHAQEQGVYTTEDYRDLYKLKDLDMIIELTGHNELANAIYLSKPERVRVMDHVSARVFWDVFRIEEESLAERLRSEEITTLAFAELNQIFETSANGMRVIDRDFNVLRVNESFATLSGRTKSEAVGRKCYDVFGGPRCHTADCPLTRILEGEERVEKDAKKKRADGTMISCIVTATAFRTPERDLVGIVEDFKDISDRKRMEVALRDSEKQYRDLVDNALVGVYKTSVEGNILYVNDGLAQMLEFDSPQEMMSEPVLLRYENLDARKTLIQSLLRDQRVSSFEVRLKTKTGKIKDTLLTAVLDKDIISGMVMDVTQRKQAEEALRESEERYRLLAETAGEMILVTDLDGRIVYVNKAGLDIAGYREDEIVGMNVSDVLPSDQVGPFNERMAKHLSGDEGLCFYETEIMTKEGQRVQAEINSSLLMNHGKPSGILHTARDVTERKRLEAQLQQAQKMEAIGTLAGGIAHDFNNVLMGIQGHASLVLLQIASNHPHVVHLRGVEQLVQKGAELTKQLLGFARGGKYEVKGTDLNELAQRSSEMFGRTRKEIKIHEKYDKEIWPVEVDQGQIEQVLLNLYVNAWQAMPRGGDLYIETSNTILDKNYTKPFNVEHGRYVRISVTDTGVGMDKATQLRIFDPFFTTREMGRGTGLGLASAYGIIKNHGGIINVYSEKGQGATFNIYLPASDKKVAAQTRSIGDEILSGTETVLLADDEEAILEVAEEILSAIGYGVLLAKSGEEAIALYSKKQGDVDLVILDMIMPGVSGGEVYDEIKKLNPKAKVLLSSGYSLEGQASEIMERGCNGFIQKPFNIQELSKRIREVLDG
jgi:two-component system cell cycle sensor histidine kinase/response regulator CckA